MFGKASDWSFPRKADALRKLGIVAPEMLERVNRTRNDLEHEYKAPKEDKVMDALDLTKVFIAYADKFLVGPSIEVRLWNDKRGTLVDMSLDYKSRQLTISTKDIRNIIDANSEEFEDYFALFIHFITAPPPISL